MFTSRLLRLHTTRSWHLMGLDLHKNKDKPSIQLAFGMEIKVEIFDTGIYIVHDYQILSNKSDMCWYLAKQRIRPEAHILCLVEKENVLYVFFLFVSLFSDDVMVFLKLIVILYCTEKHENVSVRYVHFPLETIECFSVWK